MRRRLQRRTFALLYGALAPVYDRFTAWLFLGEWARWQATALAPLADARVVVELGCGTGSLAALGGAQKTWVALDASSPMLAVAKRRAGSARLLRADARAIPLRSGSADAIVATFPAPFILAPSTGREIRRVLKPGGHLIVVLDGELAPNGLGRRWRRWALRRFYGSDHPAPNADFFAGFDGATHEIPTAHGSATRYVGRAIANGDQGPVQT